MKPFGGIIVHFGELATNFIEFLRSTYTPLGVRFRNGSSCLHFSKNHMYELEICSICSYSQIHPLRRELKLHNVIIKTKDHSTLFLFIHFMQQPLEAQKLHSVAS